MLRNLIFMWQLHYRKIIAASTLGAAFLFAVLAIAALSGGIDWWKSFTVAAGMLVATGLAYWLRTDTNRAFKRLAVDPESFCQSGAAEESYASLSSSTYRTRIAQQVVERQKKSRSMERYFLSLVAGSLVIILGYAFYMAANIPAKSDIPRPAPSTSQFGPTPTPTPLLP